MSKTQPNYEPLLNSKKDFRKGLKRNKWHHHLRPATLRWHWRNWRAYHRATAHRKKWGFAPVDAWEFDYSLAAFLHNGLLWMANNTISCPYRYIDDHDDEDSWDKGHEEWVDELRMAAALAQEVLEKVKDSPSSVEEYDAFRAKLRELFTWVVDNYLDLWD